MYSFLKSDSDCPVDLQIVPKADSKDLSTLMDRQASFLAAVLEV